MIIKSFGNECMGNAARIPHPAKVPWTLKVEYTQMLIQRITLSRIHAECDRLCCLHLQQSIGLAVKKFH